MKLKYFIFSVFFGSFLFACKSKEETTTVPPSYSVAKAGFANVDLLSTFAVSVKGEKDITINPQVSGTITNVLVVEGQYVTKGQALFTIDSPSSQQSYRTAQASVASAQAQLQTAKIDVDRYKPLADEGIISQVQYATAKNSYDVALASLQQAQAQLTNAEQVLGWTTVTSPVDGYVNDIPYRLGSLVSSATTLTTITNTKDVSAYFSMDETSLMNFLSGLEGNNTAEKIKNIPAVTLYLKDGAQYPEKGKVMSIDGMANSSTGSVTLRADFPNPDRLLRSGFSGNITIPKHLDQVLVVDQSSTFKIQDKTLLYKLNKDSINTVKSTVIDVISTPDGKKYVVTNGLNKGESYVVSGIATLRDNMKITPEISNGAAKNSSESK